MGIKQIEEAPAVEWVGKQEPFVHIPHLEHKDVYFYRKCIFGPMTISVGDFILVANADAAEPDTDAGCDIAKVLHLYELNDASSKDPWRAIVQWYSRPDCIPSKHFDSDVLVFDFNVEIIEEHRPYDPDISIETIFRKCYVINGNIADSASGLLAKYEKTKKSPMFVCRYKFVKVRNSSYALVPLQYFEEQKTTGESGRKSSARKSVTTTPSSRRSSAKKRLLNDIEFVDVQRMDENKVSPIKIVGGNYVVRLSSKKMSPTYKEINANYLSSPLTEKNHRPITPTHAKAIAARRNLNISLENEANSTTDSDFMNYSIVNNTPERKSTDIKLKLRLSETQKRSSITTRRSSMRSSVEDPLDETYTPSLRARNVQQKRLSEDDRSFIDIYHTPSKKTKENLTGATPTTRRKSILKSASSRVAEGTPKRSIQLSNIVERRIFKTDDVVTTPKGSRLQKQTGKDVDSDEEHSAPKTPSKRGRPAKQTEKDIDSNEEHSAPKTPSKRGRPAKQTEKHIDSDEEHSAPKTPSKRGRPAKQTEKDIDSDEEHSAPKTPRGRRKSSVTKQTTSESTQMTPSQKLKLIRSGSIKPSIDSRQESKTDRRKSDLQVARERLHVSVVPKSLPCRESEYLNVYTFLEGKIQDQCGGCMYVSGVPGTGKTATVTGVIRELQRLAADDKLPEFEFIEINGMRLTEPRQAYVHIYRQLTGKTVSWEHAHSLLEKRFTTPAPRRTTTVLLVDELDILCNRRQDVVYNLLDWPTKSAARLVVITIANTMDLPERLLMGKVTSRLGLTRLTFQPYSHKQLQEIVIARLSGSEAFKSDAVQLVARKVAAVSGDARRALDICRRATEIAEAQKTEPKIVNMMHVQQALGEMISSAKVMAIKNCSKLEQIFLQAVVAEVTRTGVEETNFIGVYSQIESICAFMGTAMPTPGLALRICSKLGAERLIICEHSRTDIFQKILLNVSMDDIHYALKVDN